MQQTGLVLFLLAMSLMQLSAQTSHSLMRDGDKAYQGKDYATAEEAYRKSLTLERKPNAVYNLGNSLFQQKRYEEAIEKYQQAVDISDDPALRADAFHNMGNTYFELEDYRNSVIAFENALRLRPNDQSTRYNLAQAQHLFTQTSVFDLAIKMEAAEQPDEEGLQAGDTRTYNITIVNEGDLPAKEVGLVDYLPKGMTLMDPNWTNFDSSIAQYRLRLPPIPSQDSVTVAVRFRVEDTSDPKGLFNAVEISKASNRYGKADIDSTPGNAAMNPQEDDFASDNPSQQQQQQQQQQKKDSENEEDKPQDEQQPSDQQSDQDSKQDQPQNQQDQQNQPPPNPQQQEPQQGEKQQLSPEEAMRLLKIIEEEELQVMEKLKKAKGNTTKRDKDW